MAENEIDLRALKQAVNSVLDHLIEDLGLENVPLEKDYYWDVPAPEIYDPSAKPSELTVGQLSDDVKFAGLVKRGQGGDISYNLVHIAPLLRYIAETVKK